MRKTIFSALVLSGLIANAQDYNQRVGINTPTPRASLEVKAVNIDGRAQGILFPHISEAEKARWTAHEIKGLAKGTVIWNIDKKCLDYFNGTTWQCTNGTKKNTHGTPWSIYSELAVESLGFNGTFKQGTALSGATVKFKLTNNSGADLSNLDLTNAVSVVNNGATITAVGQNANNIGIPNGGTVEITYALNGTPNTGDLTATFSYHGPSISATTPVAPKTVAEIMQSIDVVVGTPAGTYEDGTALTSTNTVTVTLTNNGSDTLSNADLRNALSITNTGATITAAAGANANPINLAPGQSITLTYTLSGTPKAGTLTANFSYEGKTASSSTTTAGRATFTQSSNNSYVVSLVYNTSRVQGKINNGANKLTVKIPYTNGAGSYNAYTNTQTTAAGEGGDVNNLTLSIDAGNFSASGELSATITVDGDGEYLVMQLAPGQDYVIATFPVTMNGTTTNIILKGIGGIPDRNFGDGKHDFIYMPIVAEDGKIWLNNNLGAEYARVPSSQNPNPDFNPMQQATSKDDYKAFGSLFQWQRKADGHELITWNPNNLSRSTKSDETTTKATNWVPSHSNFIIIGTTNDRESWTTVSAPVDYWQSGGQNNPCPNGYHVPTKSEWDNLRVAAGTRHDNTWWATVAKLKLPLPGERAALNGIIIYPSKFGYYWTSSRFNTSGGSAYILDLSRNPVDIHIGRYINGNSVRCIED